MKRRAVTPQAPDLTNDRVLSTSELVQRIPLRRQTLHRMVREGRFPPPIRLARHRIGWRWSSVLAWLAEREEKPIDRRSYFGNDDNKKSA